MKQRNNHKIELVHSYRKVTLMKRYALLIAMIVLLVAGQVFADDSSVITLDDSNPSISAEISMPANTTGVVTVNVSLAAVTLTDANGSVVFSSADPRVHYLELSIAPNSGSHTLTVQRLPGEPLASVEIGSQADMTLVTPPQDVLVDTRTVNPAQQQHTLNLDAAHPADQVALDIQPDTTGLVTASFPGAVASSQLTDSSGLLVATSSRDVDGFNLVLDGGRYALNVQANTATSDSIAADVSVMPSDQFALLGAPQAQVNAVAQSTPSCTATIASSSVNLRSGPGTGYSVLNAARQGDVLAVGGVNPEQSWVVVGTSNGSSAWVSRELTQFNGDCGQLPVFNIPLRNAQAAAVVIQQAPAPSSVAASVSSNPSTTSTHYEDDHEGEDHHSGEYDSGGEHEDD